MNHLWRSNNHKPNKQNYISLPFALFGGLTGNLLVEISHPGANLLEHIVAIMGMRERGIPRQF